MNAKHILRSLVVLGLLCAPQAASSASLSSGADFLLVTAGARPVGLGGAFSALGDDINALNANPAGLGSIQRAEVGYARYQSFAEIHYDFIAAAVPAGNAGVFALGYLGMGITPFNSTGDPSVAAVSASDTAFQGAWGRKFGQYLQAGVGVKVIQRKVNEVNGSGFAADVGVISHPVPRLALGLSALNLGPEITLVGKESLPSLLKFGASVRALEQGLHALDVAGEATLNLLSEIPFYGLGAEYWYRGQFAARAGYVGNADAQGLTAGVGARAGSFQLDYAFQPYSKLGSTHRISGIFRFDLAPKSSPSAAAAVPVPVGLASRPVADGIEVSWSPVAGSVRGYKVVLVRPSAEPKAFPEVKGCEVKLQNLSKSSPYEVQVRAVSPSGDESQPATLPIPAAR